ncbi:uncharacterized protein ACIBXB_020745 isoform 1-T2 [Morphnus guianensis]
MPPGHFSNPEPPQRGSLGGGRVTPCTPRTSPGVLSARHAVAEAVRVRVRVRVRVCGPAPPRGAAGSAVAGRPRRLGEPGRGDREGSAAVSRAIPTPCLSFPTCKTRGHHGPGGPRLVPAGGALRPCPPRHHPGGTRRGCDSQRQDGGVGDTKASLKDVETAATLEDNQTRYQDIITEALPAIHGANLEFQESLDNVRRELEAHVAEADHPRTAEKKEKLRKGVRVVAHMLRLTGRLAQTLDATSRRLHAELSRRLQSSAAHAAHAAEP